MEGDELPTTDPLQRSLDGETRIDVGAVVAEAWRLVDGSKLVVFGGFVAFYLVLFAALSLVGMFLALLGLDVVDGVGASLINLAASLALYPFMAGVFMVALRRSVDVPIAPGQLLEHYGDLVPLAVLNLLVSIGVFIGLLLLVLPGIYLMVAWSLAMPLYVDRRLGLFDALETSRRLVTPRFFPILGLYLLCGLGLAAGAFTFGIAWIWLVPWAALVLAVVYRDLAGATRFGGGAPEVARRTL